MDDDRPTSPWLTDIKTGNPMATRQSLTPSNLTSSLPVETFKHLKYFESYSVTGAFVYVQVNGGAVYYSHTTTRFRST